ncbi:MAG: adenosylhomocysteinase [Candidatus Latescibacteria bacterium]|nr:adenosylhomocysteinase [Candidatus Latescibacterota bacterium]
MPYEVKDINLAEQGLKNLEWAEIQMGALLKVRERFIKEQPLKGYRIGMALHVTKETAILVRTLIAGGAHVAIASCNPLSTQDDAAAALASEGVRVYAYKGETREDYYRFIEEVIRFKPHVTIDDGCDLISEIHTKYPELIKDIICGCEETTTGVIRLRAMEQDGALKYPVIAVNDCQTKHLMDNYYGTGQSSLDGILRASNVLISGKTLVVAGYGNCGKGVALRGKGFGANVIVTEVDPFCALQAKMDGFRVMPMAQAVVEGDLYVTVTGDLHVISMDHIRAMKDGAILANSGHFDNEVDVQGLEKAASAKRSIRPLFDEYVVDGKRVFLCGEGRLVNLACAEGHPSTVMALSFCDQALGVEYGIAHQDELEPKVYQLPPEIDQHVAELQLEAMDVRIDELTEEQKKYLSSWQEGT